MASTPLLRILKKTHNLTTTKAPILTKEFHVSELTRSRGLLFSVGDRAVQLDLIGRVRGLESAESYLNSISDKDKVGRFPYANHEGDGFCIYNDLMCLYMCTGRFEKVHEVLSDMKENGVSPDNYSYRICMKMESQPYITMDWLTYSSVASSYIKAGLKEKALIYLKKCEEIISKDALGYNHLISHYASLGNKDECRKQINGDYTTIMGSLVKIGKLEETEKLQMYQIAAGYVDKQNMDKAFECMKEALAVQAENKS
ncbi:hypothetical protein ACOSQ4_031144 [Xanthoceras sorbifolium]